MTLSLSGTSLGTPIGATPLPIIVVAGAVAATALPDSGQSSRTKPLTVPATQGDLGR